MPKHAKIGPAKTPCVFELIPQGSNFNTLSVLMTYIGNLCRVYDRPSFNYKGSNSYPILMGLSSSIFCQAIVNYAKQLSPNISFCDIDQNITLLTQYCQTIDRNFSLYEAQLLANTRAGGTNGDGGCVFGPPSPALTVSLTPPSGVSQIVYNTLRVLYTAGHFIGYFYQHHYMTQWIVPVKQIPTSMSAVGGTNPTTWYDNAYSPADYLSHKVKISHRDLARSLKTSGYPVSLKNSDVSNNNWNIMANLYSQPFSSLTRTVDNYISQGIDCTDFTRMVNYIALGVFYSSDTQNQAYGIVGNGDNWANDSSAFLAASNNSGFPVQSNGHGMSLFTGQILVNASDPSQAWTDLNNPQIQTGDVTILSPLDGSTLKTPTHGIIYLSYPYVIDSDNFIGSYPGIFVRNIATAQQYYPNTIMNSDNVFIIRRFTNFDGNNQALAPVQSYTIPVTDITQSTVVSTFTGTPISISD